MTVLEKEVLDNMIATNGAYQKKYNFFGKRQEQQQTQLFNYCLERLGLSNVSAKLVYCYRELLSNANKANLKRAFFINAGLDLDDEDDYNKGLKEFKRQNIAQQSKLEQDCRKLGFHIICCFFVTESTFSTKIINNNAITWQEIEQLQYGNEGSRYESIEQATEQVESGEGAGLGLVIVRLILQRLGLPDDSIIYQTDDESTTVSFNIPRHLQNVDDNTEEFASVVDFNKNSEELEKNLSLLS